VASIHTIQRSPAGCRPVFCWRIAASPAVARHRLPPVILDELFCDGLRAQVQLEDVPSHRWSTGGPVEESGSFYRSRGAHKTSVLCTACATYVLCAHQEAVIPAAHGENFLRLSSAAPAVEAWTKSSFPRAREVSTFVEGMFLRPRRGLYATNACVCASMPQCSPARGNRYQTDRLNISTP
jgi:hypothetical protein